MAGQVHGVDVETGGGERVDVAHPAVGAAAGAMHEHHDLVAAAGLENAGGDGPNGHRIADHSKLLLFIE